MLHDAAGLVSHFSLHDRGVSILVGRRSPVRAVQRVPRRVRRSSVKQGPDIKYSASGEFNVEEADGGGTLFSEGTEQSGGGPEEPTGGDRAPIRSSHSGSSMS
jgi:hypothetical protein